MCVYDCNVSVGLCEVSRLVRSLQLVKSFTILGIRIVWYAFMNELSQLSSSTYWSLHWLNPEEKATIYLKITRHRWRRWSHSHDSQAWLGYMHYATIQWRRFFNQSINHLLAIITWGTRKPCGRKETARCRTCSFLLKFANNIHYKYKTSQASKAATLQSSKHADA